MLKTTHLLIRVLAVSLICLPEAALSTVVHAKAVDGKTQLRAMALPGELDATFGTGGKVTTDFVGLSDSIGDAAVQADGKIVVAGTMAESGSLQFCVVRYTSNGTPDSTFGPNGVRIAPFNVFPNAIAVQADGKIVVAGSGQGTPTPFALFRLNSDGTTDTTFGTGGLATIAFAADSTILDIALQSDGKIVAGGEVAFSNSFAFARLNTNGTPDGSFGSGGKFTVNMGGAASATAIAVQSDLKIVAVGVVANDFAVARVSPDGQFDAGFGSGSGKIITNFDTGQDVAADVALQADGKIVVAGHGSFGASQTPQGIVIRYNSNGTPDGGFGTGGRVTVTGDGNRSRSLVVQADGKIVVAGHILKATPFQTDFLLLRFNTNGTPDNSFATAGTAITDFGAEDTPSALVLQPDGKVVAAGQTVNHTTNTAAFALARYLTVDSNAPVLQTEAGSNRAIALDSVTYRRDPFSITNEVNFSSDQRMRIILFATNLTLANGEPFSAVAVQAEDSGGTHNLPVEFVGKVPGFDLFTQVTVKLPDDLAKGNTLVSLTFHGLTSNKALIVVQ